MRFRVEGARDSARCQKWVCFKNVGRRGTFEEDLQTWISRGTRSTRDTFIRDVRRSGRSFLERGCILEHQAFRFAKMILRHRRSTLYDLTSLFGGRRSSSDRWSGRIGPSALHSTFHFWRQLGRNASFLMSTSKIEEVSQNCFVFDVVNFENWGSLAALLRLRCCQLWKFRKSRRIYLSSMLSTSKIEEVSRNCLVFDVAKTYIRTSGRIASFLILSTSKNLGSLTE